MSVLPALAGSGSQFVAEDDWRSAAWHTRPALSLPVAGARVVVVSAHPDDEVLALGGTLSLLAARGCRLTLVTATDGERSHPGSRSGDPVPMAARRAVELRDALAVLGVDAEPVRLGLPDSGLASAEPGLRERLAPLVVDADLVVGTWSQDGHPDHDAVGRACRSLAPGAVWEVPVWAWHWASPDDDRLPWDRVRVVDVSDRLDAKARAIACFASQVAPIGPEPEDAAVLPPEVLAHFARPLEAVLV